MSWKLAVRMHFLQDVFKMITIALVSVINQYHINGLHLFWDILYIKYFWKQSKLTQELFFSFIEKEEKIYFIYINP